MPVWLPATTNYAPSNPALTERVEADIEEFLAANPGVKREDIPADLMTASGSGLDPHVSPESAQIQIPALAQASGLSEEELSQIVGRQHHRQAAGCFRGRDRQCAGRKSGHRKGHGPGKPRQQNKGSFLSPLIGGERNAISL